MVRPAQTARSERTREALRQAAVVRFLAQGVEDTSAEQIAADAGVSLRTFYRHFASKHDLLFADYDAGLHWFRAALAARSPDESIIESVQSAIMAQAVRRLGRRQDRRRCAPRNSTRAGSCDTSARSRPTSPRRSRSTSRGTTRRSPAPTNGCASPSPRGASRPRCSARWRCGCSARTARCPSLTRLMRRGAADRCGKGIGDPA